jgi:hypothetical protein
MDPLRFIALRPLLFHLTARSNLDRIRSERVLMSTANLVERAVAKPLFALDERRVRSATLRLDHGDVAIRDENPLHNGNIAFDPGWDLARLVESLNGMVFFWPGTLVGPVASGRRHAQRYLEVGEELAFLRVPTAEVHLAAKARLSSVNSGSPRCVARRKSRRGGETFLAVSKYAKTASSVVEVVFPGSIALPNSTEWSTNLEGGWRPL